MNTKTKSNLIASILIAAATLGFLALLAPASNVVAGIAVFAALLSYGFLELKLSEKTQEFLPGRKGRIRA